MDLKPNSFFYCKPFKPGRPNEEERSYFRIFLTESEGGQSRFIYFIQPYSEFPEEISKSRGILIVFSFDFLQINTEHKDILFDQLILNNEFQHYQIKLNKENSVYLSTLFHFVLLEFKRNDAQTPKSIVSYLNIIFLNCSRLLKGKAVKKMKQHYTSFLIATKFRQLIYKYGKTERNVSFYANQLNLTPNYLNIVLKSVTNKNASTHIFDFIMNEARYLLIHTKMSLKEVAFELGFADQSYFTRFFRKQSGQNPLDWFNQNI